MAITYKLQLKFGTGSGEKTWSFSCAKQSPPAASVKALMNTMITNGSIYKFPPLEMHSATIVTTTENSISLD